jgi:hypothetical protein
MNTLKTEGAKYNIQVNTIAPVAMTHMTEGVLLSDIAPYFNPEHVSAAVAMLASEAFSESGVICSAAAGHFSLARIVRTGGLQLDPSVPPSPEGLIASWDEVADETITVEFPDAGSETTYILDAISKQSF